MRIGRSAWWKRDMLKNGRSRLRPYRKPAIRYAAVIMRRIVVTLRGFGEYLSKGNRI